jgi:single-strand DNA-binding protein
MPRSVNRVTLLGNLGKDPEVRYTQSGTAVASFSIATSSSFKDKQDQWQEKTEWHNITAWARLAEIAKEYLHKGSKVYIEGRLETQSWEDRDTKKKMYKTVIVVGELVMLDKKEEGGGNGGSYQSQGFDQTRGQQSGGREVSADDPITDEDIPF